MKEIQAETAAVKAAVEEQKDRVDKATHEVEEVVKEMKEGEEKTRNDMREIREEIKNVRDMLPKVRLRRAFIYQFFDVSSKMIEKSKESHSQSLAELQQELKSLKALLLSRGSGTPSGMATPIIPPKPSIPAWQLQGSSHVTSATSLSLPASPGAPAATIPAPTNGKGKEVEGVVSPSIS